jgi:hypothetical protein
MRKPRHLMPFAVLFLALGAAVALSAPSPARQAGQDERLARVLGKAKAYCLRLERAALDFICTEKIEEKIYQLPKIRLDEDGDQPGLSRIDTSPQMSDTNTLVYDYQFVRKGDLKKERRILIEENARKRKRDDAELATRTVRVENALFGPIGLLGADWQPRHDYRIDGEESHDGKTVLVIEAVTKPSLDRPHCFGRIWVREDDGSVVKIAWDQTSVGNFAQVEAEARRLEAEPRLTSITEYDVVKNGIRFPSRDTTEEAYVLKTGRALVKSQTTIVYADYKFFTVETDVKY